MSPGPDQVTERYYRDFASQGNFESVPMSDELRFTGPLHDYVDGLRYRRDCVALAAMAVGIEIRHQFIDHDQAHTVYDLDLGLPTGPIASCETLTFADGTLISADLIIDSTPLRHMATQS